MIKRLQSVFVLLCAICFALACKKDEKVEIPKEFPVVLKAERFEVRKETRLFTNNQEIKDRGVIQQFEQRHAYFDQATNNFNEGLGLYSLRFDAEQAAHFYEEEPAGVKVSIDRKGTRFLFYTQDVIWISPLNPPSASSLGYFHHLNVYKDQLGVAGPDGLHSTRSIRVAHGNFKVLKLSALAFVLKVKTPEGDLSQIVHEGIFYNEFDEDVKAYLKAQDTLAVKEYSIIYSLSN
jgi:hypothetical protein